MRLSYMSPTSLEFSLKQLFEIFLRGQLGEEATNPFDMKLILGNRCCECVRSLKEGI